ncbi:hypothetical protein CR513_48365, partial [Mucuna pruriens]
MSARGHSPSLEDLMKQLATSNLEFQQTMILAKYEHHNSRPQDANRIVSQCCKPVTASWIQQPTLTNHSKSERECKCSHVKKWKSIATASIIVVSKISGCRLRARGRLTGAAIGENCPIAISNSGSLNKEA